MTAEERCFLILLRKASRLQRRLTPREVLVFRAGLHASHAEEALMGSDELRAAAHFRSLVKISKRLFPS